ncbi:MAG: alpha/beta fold hydrolase [Trueperaceae bacterium]
MLKYFPLGFLLLLVSCVPRVALPAEPTTIPDAEAATVNYDKYQTYYEHLGRDAGDPVLMIHGIGGGSSVFQYRFAAPALAKSGYKVYALDLLGFGKSSRPKIRYTQELLIGQMVSFLETVIQEPTILVANSLTAAYSIRIAAERPDLVKALVLTGPTGYERLARPQDEGRIRSFKTFSGALGSVLFGVITTDNWQEYFLLDAYGSRESLTPEVRASYDQNLKVENAEWVIYSFISGNLDQSIADIWPTLTTPTLLLWGKKDGNFLRFTDSEAFIAARPDAAFVTFENSKLLPNEDEPELYNKAVIEFLRGLE